MESKENNPEPVYTVKERFYSSPDQFGESYVLVSDNSGKDLKLEVGQKVRITLLP